MRTRSPPRHSPDGPADLDTLPHKIDVCWRTTMRCAAATTCRRSTARASWLVIGDRRSCCPMPKPAAARPQAPRGQAHPVRSAHGRCSTSTRHLSLRDVVQHGGGTGRDGHRPARAVGYVLGICKLHHPRRPGPFPTELLDEMARKRPPRQGIRCQHRPQAPGRLVDAMLVRQTVRPAELPGWR